MTPQLLEKVREIEAAAGANWMAKMANINDVNQLRGWLAEYNLEIDDTLADEAMALVSSAGVKELSDADLEMVAGGSISKYIN